MATFTNGMSGSAAFSELNKLLDKTIDDTATGRIIFDDGITIENIYDSDGDVAININSGAVSIYDSPMVTMNSLFTNYGVMKVDFTHATPISFDVIDLIESVVVVEYNNTTVVNTHTMNKSDGYDFTKSLYLLGGASHNFTITATYPASYNYSTFIANVTNLKGGETMDVEINLDGDRNTMKSGYIESEGKFYIYFKTTRSPWTPPTNITADIFMVGAGGGWLNSYLTSGGSGYTHTINSYGFSSSASYKINVGAGMSADTGGESNVKTSADAYIITSPVASKALGGNRNTSTTGGAGGSGGGGYTDTDTYIAGGSNGANGTNGTVSNGGTGQGTTTREFGEITGKLYAAGGSAQGTTLTASAVDGIGGYYYGLPLANTGSGAARLASAGNTSQAGASGIVVMRWTV